MAEKEPRDEQPRSFVTLTSGTAVSHYEIVKKIGSGGMGDVYMAWDSQLERNVALKFLSPRLCEDKDCRSRFKREARAVAKLDHPNIITIHQVDDYQGRLYFAMQLVEGTPLESLIASRELTEDRILDLGIGICEGLQEAHEAGVIHRDIKPSNILIDRNGRPKILDFGIAAIIGTETLTHNPSVVGTPRYMSPEQAQGMNVDHRSDLFSLGSVLYEMIAGEAPFCGEYTAEEVYRVINETPKPLPETAARMSAGLQAVVQKMLEKKVDRRYQTAAEAVRDLKKLRGDGQIALQTPEETPSIAVLPFRDVSPQKDQEYFCEGLAEELINGLTGIDRLKVTSRTSSLQFKDAKLDLREIGRRLNVTTVLEGSVRKSGRKLRITTQLINVADGFHLWSEKYDRDIDDVFAIQDEISLTVVDKLKLKLLGEERSKLVKRGTVNQEAYNLYLKGRYFWNRRYEVGIQKALECFQASIAQDAGFALAYSGMADCYNLLGFYGLIHSREAFAGAKAAAEKALSIDDSLAEPHTSLGWIRMFFDRDWQSAEREFALAIDLNPRYATAHEWYSILLAILGRGDESLASILRARELDPLSLVMNAMLGWVYYISRRYDDAMRQCRETIDIDPNFSLVFFFYALACSGESMWEEGIEATGRLLALSPGITFPYGLLGYQYAMSGKTGEAHQMLEKLREEGQQRYVSPFYSGVVYVGLNDMETAFKFFDDSYEQDDSWLPFLMCWPIFDGVRADPRFDSLLTKIGLQ